MVSTRRSLLAAALVVVAPLALAACGGGGDDKAKPVTGSSAPAPGASAGPESATVGGSQPEALSLRVTPDAGKKGVPVSAEIGVKVSGGKVTTVAVKDDKGKSVAGSLREDRSAWVPARPLKNSKTYEASVTAVSEAGTSRTETTKFTTMAKPAKETGTGLYLFDDHTYGVAMPVVVEFNPGIKKNDRAAVQKRMFVKSEPAQPGTWSWTSNGTQAYYRPPNFWQSGTKLTVRIAVGGLPTGGGRYGDQDRSASAKIGRSFVMKVDNKAKKMTVVQDGKTVRTLPVSLGAPKHPSSSGTMVVMEKLAATVFDTRGEVPAGESYVTNIEYAQRLTWSGQYIHSAPWSVGSQGRRNVSHGCVNVSPSNARWLFDKTLVGDPVTVRGTEDKLVYGNGWTPWDLSWKEFVKGSALPVPAELAAQAGQA
ncbi:Ig-like domain-containing protein [Actinoplanes sp. N902-109]|uniref:L,D-transpeptidase n=1 Tax=Actinoplanes sp. (strain N902-109) TaxID=649831 RepID=UPI0003295E30|nr:Ig-like domain-containing protein [Actinoplanes sp. N902-109]AGL14841.1 erfk/ybis/ycfs/ynhg family protein [Actinoplanes sp. N902-109]